MRYMATLYISDVMDQVAGTIEIQGWERQYGPPETIYEHTWLRQGYGELEPSRWLYRALIACLADMAPPASEGTETGGPDGGTHTLSETGDKAQIVVGWTAVGGPGRADRTAARSASARI